MKYLLRSLIFTYFSLVFTQKVIGAYFFGGRGYMTLLLVGFGLALLNISLAPIFKLISLPDKGISFMFLSFIMTLITTRVMTFVIPYFDILPATLGELNFFGIVLPSKNLTVFWSSVFSALLLSIIYNFFVWLCAGKKKRR